ncbi:MAG: hypothetical protein JO356_13070 [Acidobacteria bacterium]|nr:hypothetical protein [Acidobacteriota bacterium]
MARRPLRFNCGGNAMQWNGKRIITLITLVSGGVTTYQLLSKPQPIAAPQTVASARANLQSFDQKLGQLSVPRTTGSAPAEVHFTSDEVSAEMAEAVGALPAGPVRGAKSVSSSPTSPDTVVAPGDVQVKDYQVKLEGDVARGQFLTKIAGKDVYVTLAGHLGSEDGYVTFEATEFKVGDLNIPVSLMNSALQKKLAEQRDQLRLPQDVAALRVENGELVITQK